MSNPEAGTRQAIDADAVDDRGTTQEEARTLLTKLRDQGFDSSDEQLAVALGRPVEEVKGWIEGTEPVDDDVIMKARGIALQRGIEIE
jgi:hypothetical protein